MKALLIALILTLSSCSAQWHLNQAIKKDPTIVTRSQSVVFDTLIKIDSVVYHDTFAYIDFLTDTLVVNQEKASVVIYKYKDRVHVKTKIKNDTIRINKTITIPKPIYVNINEHKIGWYSLFALVGIIFGVYLSRKND